MLIVGQSSNKRIYGQTQTFGCPRFQQMQLAVQDRQIFIGRNHVHPVPNDFHTIPSLCHRQRRHPLQQFRQHTLMIGVEMLDHHKCHAAGRRHMNKKLLQGLQAACRCAYGDNWRHNVRGDAGFVDAQNFGCFIDRTERRQSIGA